MSFIFFKNIRQSGRFRFHDFGKSTSTSVFWPGGYEKMNLKVLHFPGIRQYRLLADSHFSVLQPGSSSQSFQIEKEGHSSEKRRGGRICHIRNLSTVGTKVTNSELMWIYFALFKAYDLPVKYALLYGGHLQRVAGRNAFNWKQVQFRNKKCHTMANYLQICFCKSTAGFPALEGSIPAILAISCK